MAGKGGARPGAGRKKGIANKIDAKVKKAALESGVTPLEYMLKVMRNTQADGKRRDQMAIAAAPYLHPKLASIQHTGKDGGPIETLDLSKATDDQLATLKSFLGPLVGVAGVGAGLGGGEEAND